MLRLFELDASLQEIKIFDSKNEYTHLLLNHRLHILISVDVAGLHERIARSLRVVQVVVEGQHDPFHLFNGIVSQGVLS